MLLFGKGGRGMFEVRISPDEDGAETVDSRVWDIEGSQNECYFPVDSTETTQAHQRSWPFVDEGYELDLYVRQPDQLVGLNSPREDWEMDNVCICLIDDKWQVVELHGWRKCRPTTGTIGAMSQLHTMITTRQADLGLSTNRLAREVADAAGCAPSTVRRYLDGTHDTTTVVLEHLLERLGFSVRLD